MSKENEPHRSLCSFGGASKKRANLTYPTLKCTVTEPTGNCGPRQSAGNIEGDSYPEKSER